MPRGEPRLAAGPARAVLPRRQKQSPSPCVPYLTPVYYPGQVRRGQGHHVHTRYWIWLRTLKVRFLFNKRCKWQIRYVPKRSANFGQRGGVGDNNLLLPSAISPSISLIFMQFFFYKTNVKWESIPVGCVPSATTAAIGEGVVVCPGKCLPRGTSRHSLPSWTEWQTHVKSLLSWKFAKF